MTGQNSPPVISQCLIKNWRPLFFSFRCIYRLSFINNNLLLLIYQTINYRLNYTFDYWDRAILVCQFQLCQLDPQVSQKCNFSPLGSNCVNWVLQVLQLCAILVPSDTWMSLQQVPINRGTKSHNCDTWETQLKPGELKSHLSSFYLIPLVFHLQNVRWRRPFLLILLLFIIF